MHILPPPPEKLSAYVESFGNIMSVPEYKNRKACFPVFIITYTVPKHSSVCCIPHNSFCHGRLRSKSRIPRKALNGSVLPIRRRMGRGLQSVTDIPYTGRRISFFTSEI